MYMNIRQQQGYETKLVPFLRILNAIWPDPRPWPVDLSITYEINRKERASNEYSLAIFLWGQVLSTTMHRLVVSVSFREVKETVGRTVPKFPQSWVDGGHVPKEGLLQLRILHIFKLGAAELFRDPEALHVEPS